MRIGIVSFIILITAIQLFQAAPAHSQTIEQVEVNLELKNESLIKGFRKIEAQSPFHFMYRNADVKDVQKLNFPAARRSISSILETLLRETSLTYKQVDNRILIIPVSESIKSEDPADKITVVKTPVVGSLKGKVTDGKSMIIPGVSVKIVGPSKLSASTGIDGNYVFSNLLPGTYTVSLNFIGFAPAETKIVIKAGEQSTVNTVLQEDIRSLEEVVVVAYGSQKKASLTSAAASIQGTTIANIPVANITNALGGRLAGLITFQGSGEPGADESSMYIRGISSTGATQPLLVVDGIPRSFTQLDPQTIETITVLKDAAAAAPYGLAGANGVILVTTKLGRSGSPTLTFNSSFGVQNLSDMPELPTSFEFASLKNAASINDGLAPPYSETDLQKFKLAADPDKYPNTNAHELLIDKNTPLISHSIQLFGGAERLRYFASVGHLLQQGIFKPIQANKYTLSLNLESQVTASTTVSLKLNTRQQNNSYSGIRTSDLFVYLNYALPTQPIFWSNGKPASSIYPVIYESGSNKSRNSHVFSQLSVDQKLDFIPGLSLRSTLAYDPSFMLSKQWVTPTHVWTADLNTTPYTFTDAIFGNPKASLTQGVSNPRSLTFQASLNYNRAFGKSDIGALALFESRSTKQMSFGAARLNYNLLVDELSVGSSNPLDILNSGSSSESRQIGAVYRLSYSYDGKYLAEATGRYDGHYYFAPGQRFGFFPAASVGWRVSEENFIKHNLPYISNLKLRGSYGEVGALAGSPFQYLNTYTVNSNTTVLGGVPVQGITERNEPNPNITWERARKSNIGIEASFWRDLLMVEADYFFEKRSNMLVSPTVVTPVEYGVSLSQVNGGRMKNQGYEVSIGSRYDFSPDLGVSLGVNLTHAKNTVLEIFETASTYNSPNRRVTGRSLGTQFGYEALGFYLPEDFMTDGSLKPGVTAGPTTAKLYPGDLKYKDINGDLKITNDDIVPIGNPVAPQIFYGFNSNIRYKAFNLDLLFQGSYGRNVYLSDWIVWPFNVGRGAYKHNLDYWRPDNLSARNPRITNAPAANNTVISSWWLNDASYLRLKNVQLSYELPEDLAGKLGMQKANLTVAAQNLITWSAMKYDYDPEAGTNLGSYPSQQVISMGFNITF
jgi:TonB-linked SusC/RagA family outer membrane protein